MYKDKNNNLTHTFSEEFECPGCGQTMVELGGKFLSTPAWLFFDVNYDNDVKVNCSDVPKTIKVNEFTYKLILCQIRMSHMAHFKGIFLINDKFYLLDEQPKET